MPLAKLKPGQPFRAMRFALASGCVLAAYGIAWSAPGETGYEVQTRWAVGGEGKWDALVVDEAHRRLYVSRATRVQVLDLDSGKLLAEIANTPGVHGIALAVDLNRGFTSNGKGDSVTVFRLDTFATLGEVKISGQDPDAIVYDAPSKRVYAFNGHSNNATVIDAATAKEVGSVALPGRPEFALSDGKGRLFVNLEDKNAVAVIDIAAGTVRSTWSLAPCDGPTGIALDKSHHRLFCACRNKSLIVMDSESGKRIAQLPIGAHVDGAAFDPATSLVFSANGDSADVTVIHEESADQYTVRGSLPTATGAKTMALDLKSHKLYLPAMTPTGFQILVAAPK
jgi:YVTN family beta-propeller protein